MIQPYPTGFTNNPDLPKGCGRTFFIGLTFCPPAASHADVANGGNRPTVDISTPVRIWKQHVKAWPEKAADMDVHVSIIQKVQLPSFVKDLIPKEPNKKKKKKNKKKNKSPVAISAAASSAPATAIAPAVGAGAKSATTTTPATLSGEGDNAGGGIKGSVGGASNPDKQQPHDGNNHGPNNASAQHKASDGNANGVDSSGRNGSGSDGLAGSGQGTKRSVTEVTTDNPAPSPEGDGAKRARTEKAVAPSASGGGQSAGVAPGNGAASNVNKSGSGSGPSVPDASVEEPSISTRLRALAAAKGNATAVVNDELVTEMTAGGGVRNAAAERGAISVKFHTGGAPALKKAGGAGDAAGNASGAGAGAGTTEGGAGAEKAG